MTDLLKKAFDAVPQDEQDAVAEWLLGKLASEEGLEERFAGTQAAMSVFAREASEEHKRGETKELDPGLLRGQGRPAGSEGPRHAYRSLSRTGREKPTGGSSRTRITRVYASSGFTPRSRSTRSG